MQINIAIIFLLVINLLIFITFSADNKNSEKEQNLNNQQHLTQQKNSSQIRLLTLEEIHNLENPQNISQNISQNVAENQNPEIQETQENQENQQVQQCFIWKNVKVADDDFKKIQRILVEKNFSQLKIVDSNQIQEISNNRWWIYIPPFASRQDAEKRAKELLQNTITEYFIIKDGEFKNAISLGIFSQEKTATDFLKGLRLRNVNEAKMLIRENKKLIKNVEISNFISEQQFKNFIEILKKNKVNLNFLSNTDFSKC